MSMYEYLGAVITNKLSMNEHLREREKMSKNGMNVLWREIVSNVFIRLSDKYRLLSDVEVT